MGAKFEILQPGAGEFRWVLTNQGRVLARSEAYTRRLACLNAMESFRKAVPTAEVVDITARAAEPGPVPTTTSAKVARTTGRVVGLAAAMVAEAPSLVVEAAKKVVETVTPGPRRPTAGTG